MAVLCKLPEYLIRNGYKVPEDPTTGPFAYTFGKGQWEYFEDHPERSQSFNIFMGQARLGGLNWLDHYPWDQQLLHDLRQGQDAVLLIDVAGNRGHDIKDFKARHGTLPGRCILQDLPEVIAHADPMWTEGIEPMSYDFFTPQPIKGKQPRTVQDTLLVMLTDISLGARVYYFRRILHDWDDKSCRRILRNQMSAMDKQYSRLLINDLVLPDVGVTMHAAGMDVYMMALLCGMERTRSQWNELLDSVGLKVNGIWTLGEGPESIIETSLKG